jgi:pyruvate ferredoxin oxidoreductase gamma subunit
MLKERSVQIHLRPGMAQIRWHGRGGQGVVTASELLAEAALHEGQHVQAFPDYGAERMGAPVEAYTRLGDRPIEAHYSILQPDVVVVANPNLLGIQPVTEGLPENGSLIINTPRTPQEMREQLGFYQGRVITVDATRIALDVLGRNIPSTLMLGAVVKATGLVSLESLVDAARARLGGRLSPSVVEANVTAMRRAFAEAREG